MSHLFDIFLSHNGSDKAWTEKLALEIERNTDGIPLKVFFDKWDVLPGTDIPGELETALSKSRFIGLIMSPAAFESEWVAFERSVAIMRDPSAKQKSIIPILRKPCEVPITIKRLNFLDFSDDNKFSENLNILLKVLRNESIPRGTDLSFEQLYLQEDQRQARQYLDVFQRGCFTMACYWEVSLIGMIKGIEHVQTALNTGQLFRNDNSLVKEFPSINQFKTKEYKSEFRRISLLLSELKVLIGEYFDVFKKECHNKEIVNLYGRLDSMPKEFVWQRFKLRVRLFLNQFLGRISKNDDLPDMYPLADWFMILEKKGKANKLKSAVQKMDQIDHKRNEITMIVCKLANEPHRSLYCEISSDIIRETQIEPFYKYLD